jgi:hypothetical protein
LTRPTKQRVHRILARMEFFTWIGSGAETPEPVGDLGPWLGVYRPSQEDPTLSIWVAEKGIRYFDKDWISLRYSEICSVGYPREKTGPLQPLILQLQSGESQRLLVWGQRGKFRDLYEVGRFLDRVVGDLRGPNPDSRLE